MGKARHNPGFSVHSQYCSLCYLALVVCSTYLFCTPDMRIIKISGGGEQPPCCSKQRSACTLMPLGSHQSHLADGFVVVPFPQHLNTSPPLVSQLAHSELSLLNS